MATAKIPKTLEATTLLLEPLQSAEQRQPRTSRPFLRETHTKGCLRHTQDDSCRFSSNCLSTASERAWRKPSMVTVGAWEESRVVILLLPHLGTGLDEGR